MSIRREDIDLIDLSDVVTGEPMPLSSPGAILREDFMAPLNLSANALAAALRVPTNRITSIIKGTRGITADTALRLGRYFGTTPEFWMGLQMDYDLRNARRENLSRVEQDVTPRAA